MPSPGSTPHSTPHSTPTRPQLHVSDTVLARVAAYHACRVPGVLRLRPDLAQTMTSIVTRLFSPRVPPRDGDKRISTDGVTAVIEDGHAVISIALITRWGRNCRDIAEQVQHQVAEQVRCYTGIPATVSVTITGVDHGG